MFDFDSLLFYSIAKSKSCDNHCMNLLLVNFIAVSDIFIQKKIVSPSAISCTFLSMKSLNFRKWSRGAIRQSACCHDASLSLQYT